MNQRQLSDEELRAIRFADSANVFRYCPIRGSLHSVRDMPLGHLVAHALGGPTEPDNLFPVSAAGNDDIGSKTWPEIRASMVEKLTLGLPVEAITTAREFIARGDAAWARWGCSEKRVSLPTANREPCPEVVPKPASEPAMNDASSIGAALSASFRAKLVHGAATARTDKTRAYYATALSEFDAGKSAWADIARTTSLANARITEGKWVFGDICEQCGASLRYGPKEGQPGACVTCQNARTLAKNLLYEEEGRVGSR